MTVFPVNLSTTTVRQLLLSPRFLLDSIVSASKCPNSKRKLASMLLKSISVLLGIFVPVLYLLIFRGFRPYFLLRRYCVKLGFIDVLINCFVMNFYTILLIVRLSAVEINCKPIITGFLIAKLFNFIPLCDFNQSDFTLICV